MALGTVLLACGGGSGGGSEAGPTTPGQTPEVLATQPVDLPPGQTIARIAWKPSTGAVSGYLLFLSRNRGSFDFEQQTDEANAVINGGAGDEVRILVVAINETGDMSEASPPSPPIRFSASPASQPSASTAAKPTFERLPATGVSSDPVADFGSQSAGVTDPPPADSTAGDPLPAADVSPTSAPADSGTPADRKTALLTAAARDRLLQIDLRTPLAGLSASARSWIEPWIASEVAADIEPIGTAERPLDDFRDIVWRDGTGQLFLSDGPQLAQADSAASMLIPAIQLLAGERFVGLVDVDGDGLRDWIVEDTTTGSVSFRPDELSPTRPARAAGQSETALLLGPGDLDGDGRAELLWQNDDGSLALARPDGSFPRIFAGAPPTLGDRIVAIADLSGDGRDDLIARGDDGLLSVGVASTDPDTGTLDILWLEGLVEAGASAELIATVDLDQDGRAELVWLVEGQAEIRGLGEAAPRVF
jgi:hypothetical protein